MKQVLRVAASVVTLFGVLATTSALGPASASTRSQSDYTVASFSIDDGGGAPELFNFVKVGLCLPPLTETCFTEEEGGPTLIFSPIDASGMTIWTDAATPNFNVIVNGLTDGVTELVGWTTGPPDVFITGASSFEPDLFGDQVGPSGVDLAGYRIDRIGFRVDSFSLASPGTDPNGDGIWTDWTLNGTFLFEGRIASTDACKNGGWQSLHGPGGSSFENQGQCIRFVNTSGP
jgi:hypothetical protein